MVKLRDIISFLENLINPQLQDSWDNSGLQVGWKEKEIKRIGFALSVSKDVIAQAREKQLDLIITHHPVTISAIKSLNDFSYPSNLLLELAKSGISVYALHTDLDVSPFGPTAMIAERLGVKKLSSITENPPYGIIGTLNPSLTQEELFKKLKSFLPKDVYRGINFKAENIAKRVAICSGSGASFIGLVTGRVDVYITGDVKYHDAMKAVDLGLTVFDMGHFGTERLFFDRLKDILKMEFKNLTLTVLKEKSPYEVV